jgi:hypothetical protein
MKALAARANAGAPNAVRRVGVADRREVGAPAPTRERERPFDFAQGRPELVEGRAGVGPRVQ